MRTIISSRRRMSPLIKKVGEMYDRPLPDAKVKTSAKPITALKIQSALSYISLWPRFSNNYNYSSSSQTETIFLDQIHFQRWVLCHRHSLQGRASYTRIEELEVTLLLLDRPCGHSQAFFVDRWNMANYFILVISTRNNI